MKSIAVQSFWQSYGQLPPNIQRLARKIFELWQHDPRHPSLHFKKVDGLWSVRVGGNYRVLGYPKDNGFVWIWVGPHKEYEKILKGK